MRKSQKHNPLHRATNLLFRRPLIVITVFALSGGIAMLWQVQRVEENLVRSMSLKHATVYSDVLKEVRSVYRSEVVERLESQGVVVTHDYKLMDGSIPLPETLSMLLASG